VNKGEPKQKEPGAKHHFRNALMILLAFPVLYVLSLGPLIVVYRKIDSRTVRKHQDTVELIGSIYRPLLESAAEEKSVGGKLMRSYIYLWVPREIELFPNETSEGN
jgi:hypothetical protein